MSFDESVFINITLGGGNITLNFLLCDKCKTLVQGEFVYNILEHVPTANINYNNFITSSIHRKETFCFTTNSSSSTFITTSFGAELVCFHILYVHEMLFVFSHSEQEMYASQNTPVYKLSNGTMVMTPK